VVKSTNIGTLVLRGPIPSANIRSTVEDYIYVLDGLTERFRLLEVTNHDLGAHPQRDA
jgi:hypothetical protein